MEGGPRRNRLMADRNLRPIDELEQTILARQVSPSEKSYTAQLLAGGIERIGGKVVEEATEVVEAAGEQGDEGRTHTILEAGDLVYHLLVLLAARGISFSEVEAELARRAGVSGLEEKANRSK
jgi:phosphoribosyl-ATP pyrophosphohydrolase